MILIAACVYCHLLSNYLSQRCPICSVCELYTMSTIMTFLYIHLYVKINLYRQPDDDGNDLELVWSETVVTSPSILDVVLSGKRL